MTLAPFDNLPVLQTSLSLTNAGDGLSQAMKTAPEEFHHGQRIFIVYEAEVVKVRHDLIDKDDPTLGLARVHIAKAEVATLVDEDFVAERLKAQKIANEKLKDAEAGVTRIPGTIPELDANHDDGLPARYDDDDTDPDPIPEDDTP